MLPSARDSYSTCKCHATSLSLAHCCTWALVKWIPWSDAVLSGTAYATTAVPQWYGICQQKEWDRQQSEHIYVPARQAGVWCNPTAIAEVSRVLWYCAKLCGFLSSPGGQMDKLKTCLYCSLWLSRNAMLLLAWFRVLCALVSFEAKMPWQKAALGGFSCHCIC